MMVLEGKSVMKETLRRNMEPRIIMKGRISSKMKLLKSLRMTRNLFRKVALKCSQNLLQQPSYLSMLSKSKVEFDLSTFLDCFDELFYLSIICLYVSGPLSLFLMSSISSPSDS